MKIKREIFLENLPRISYGHNKGKIDWDKSIGSKVKFIYNRIKGELEIVDIKKCYKQKFLIIKYNNKSYEISISNFKRCGLGGILGITKKTSDFAERGVNDIYTTDKWLCEYIVDKNIWYNYTSKYSKKILMKCPHCGKVKWCTIYELKTKGYLPCVCGDNYSKIYKYVYNVLEQVNANFKTEVKYEWNKYKNPLKNNKLSQASIDFVIYYNGREIPLEADGRFHRENNNMSGMTAEQSMYIDKQRDENCLIYLNEETIRISDYGDIKENIINSELNKIFDLSNIDWSQCEEYSTKNIVYEVCDYWKKHREINNEKISTTDLSKKFNIDRGTVRSYLKQGNNLGWCNYNLKEEQERKNEKVSATNKEKYGKQINVYKEGVLIGTFNGCNELAKKSFDLFGVTFYSSCISRCANGEILQHKGYVFKYV